jgi:hypothetical protein
MESPVHTAVQDNTKIKGTCKHVTTEESDDDKEFSDGEDGFVMMTSAATMLPEIAAQSIATQVPFT